MIDHPLGWTLEQRLEHCNRMVEKTMDRYPAIAQLWYNAALLLEKHLAERASHEAGVRLPSLDC